MNIVPITRKLLSFLIINTLIFSTVTDSFCQNDTTLSIFDLQRQAVRVYIDCAYCDLDYIRKEIQYVNYVRDRHEAQVHVLVTTQQTAAGGQEYTLTFVGKETFWRIDDTLTFTTKKDDTDEMIRRELVRVLRLGLIRYIAKTPLSKNLTISYDAPTAAEKVTDPWNYWVFSLSVNGFSNGEKSYNYLSLWGR